LSGRNKMLFLKLKVEAIYPYCFKNRLDAKLSVFEYVETWYNKNRIGGLTINEFEKFNQLKHVT
ncbi:MAG: IS3 family transposase, partial [Flavobacteriales bacterium]|nr:IS3 family transposase [Flavobacteriales bacterium]